MELGPKVVRCLAEGITLDRINPVIRAELLAPSGIYSMLQICWRLVTLLLRGPPRFGGFAKLFEAPECCYRLDEILIMSAPASSNVFH
jgi:hypothetical protein